MRRFDSKIVAVTGAADGIGLAAVRRFAGEGATVVAVDTDVEALESARPEFGDAVHWVHADVADDSTDHDWVGRTVDQFGRLDVVFLNAGIQGRLGPITDVPVEEFDRVIAVNLRGVWIGLSRSMVAMQTSGGVITITSSTGGLRGSAGLAPYVASKHAVVGLMKSAALEGARYGIRVNTLHPGGTATKMLDAISSDAPASDSKSNPAASVPLGRLADPVEMAALVAFLSSDEAGYITGSTVLADGGVLAGSVPAPD